MRNIHILLYEWKHFIRNSFKVIAVVLFVLASIYGLHNGANLYKKQNAEIEKIKQKVEEQQRKIIAYYDKGQKGPQDRPWVDITTPFGAVWNLSTYCVKSPSPAMVYSIGQAEQYGFYKQISVWASPYDADMAEEISNPERLQIGTLDFSFTTLFLLPLLFLILVYNVKSSETEQGFLPLVYVQTASKNNWLISRLAFYAVLLFIVNTVLIVYGALLTNVFTTHNSAFLQVLLYTSLYIAFWWIIYYFIIQKGKSVLGNTFKMVGIWLLVCFIIPGSVNLWISIIKPVNLMTNLIDANQDESSKIYEQPDSVIQQQLISLYPAIAKSSIINDTIKSKNARGNSVSALNNQLLKSSITPIVQDNEAKNRLIQQTYFINPYTFFQSKFNTVAKTHYNDYEKYRQHIQALIDKTLEIMIIDVWQDVKVDKQRYLAYTKKLSTLK